MKTFKQFCNESTRITKRIGELEAIVKNPNANFMDKVRAVEAMKQINDKVGTGSLKVPGV